MIFTLEQLSAPINAQLLDGEQIDATSLRHVPQRNSFFSYIFFNQVVTEFLLRLAVIVMPRAAVRRVHR
jgi:hypothetical protein